MTPETKELAAEAMREAEQFLRQWNDAPHIAAKLRAALAAMGTRPAL